MIWPDDYKGSWTLKSPILMSGIGLHTGEESKVRLLPTDIPGFHISWFDQSDPPITINAQQVRHTPLCTTLEIGKHKLSTVEHMLAALVGCGLTHVHIQVSGEEIPLLDGSALCWVESIQKVGYSPAKTPGRAVPVLSQPLVIHRGDSVITVIPADKFKVIGIIDFSYQAIGQQMFSIELSPNNFVKEIAPARTFGFLDQIEALKKQGLVKGGDLNNALVCTGDSWLNPPLRFKDEPVRHKLLDLIGDLAFIGLPKAQILVYRGSHALHADLVTAFLKNCSIA